VPEANTLRPIQTLPAKPSVVRIAAADHNDISQHQEFDAALSGIMSP
jgi:hypothetical protein